MLRHLPEDVLVDLLEGEGAAADRAHAESCTACRERLCALRAGLALAREADVPEPSPLYWAAFRERLAERLDGVAPLAGPRAWLLGWRPMLAAAAVLAAALGLTVGRSGTPSVRPEAASEPAWAPLPPSAQDAGLALLESVLLDADGDLAIEGCRGLASCLVDLTESESQAMAEAVRQDLRGKVS